MNVIFVAGTDTGVGKTVVTGLLGRYLLGKGYSVVTQKWLQTGPQGLSGDIAVHLKFMGKRIKDFKGYLPFMMPYSFRSPCSPHLAARLERKGIDVTKIEKALRGLTKDFDFVVIEGVGGILVPLSRTTLLVDLVKELGLPVLIVAGNKLGAINHTLLTIEGLRARRIKIIGVLFNNISRDEDNMILRDNPKIVKELSGETVLGILPWAKDPLDLRERFAPIGDRILSRHG